MKIIDVSDEVFMSVYLGEAEAEGMPKTRVSIGSRSLFFRVDGKRYRVDLTDIIWEVVRAHLKLLSRGEVRQIRFKEGWIIEELAKAEQAEKGGRDED